MTIERTGGNDRMSDVVTHNGVAYLSGIVGRRGTSVAEQTQSALEDIDRLLASVGTDRRHVLSAMIWLADVRDMDEMNGVWDAWIDKAHRPVRATGGVLLARSRYRVEIMITAALPDA